MRLLSLPLSTLLLFSSAFAHNADTELEIETTRKVNCTRPTRAGDLITVNYVGTLAFDGSKFDSSYDYGQPFVFTIGKGQVIKGWDLGLLDMCVGEARKLTIPPAYGYGDRTVGAIPGGSTIVFDTELLGIAGVQDYDPTKPVAPQPSPASTTPTATPAAMNSPSASAASQTAPASPYGHEDDDGECHLLGPFALFVQGALGGLALLSLVWKRYRETPRRPLKIWSFDVSKQVVGSVLLHLANLFMSMLSSGTFDVSSAPLPGPSVVVQGNGQEKKVQPNPCSFYLLNLAIDTTIGIPILVLLLRILHALFLYTPLANPPASIKSGNYGDPPRWTWWMKQCIIYFLGLFGMKFCVLIIFQLLPWIAWVGDWALRWTEGNQKVQIAFVMFVFPLIMNALQYYIIDSFIKQRDTGEEGEDTGDRGEHRPLRQRDDDDDDDSDDDDIVEESRRNMRRNRRNRSFAVGDDGDDAEVEIVKAAPLKEANPTTVPAYDEVHPDRGSSSSDGNGESPRGKNTKE